MKAIRLHEFGPADNLLLEEVPAPVPREGQVRIRTQASGVQLIDTTIRAGTHAGSGPLPTLPITLGRDVAGAVDAVGDGVDEALVGEHVVAYLGPAGGGYAEMAVVAADALHVIPEGLDATSAVAMIGTGRTAVGILDLAAIEADDVVLVTSAAGGLGTLFLQAAKNAGAVAVGAAGGAAKVEQARRNGATVAVDYTEDGWERQVRDRLGGRDVTVVLDGVGGAVGRVAMDLLGMGGRMLMFGWSSGEKIEFSSADIIGGGLTVGWAIPRLLRQSGGLRVLESRALAEAAAGRLTPAVQRFPLASAAEAHKALENRSTMGKVVLVNDA